LELLVGGSVENNYFDNNSTQRLNIQGNELPALNLGGVENITNDWNAGEWGIVSGFSRLKYDYQERYLLEATVRIDGSSRFPENERWGVFPSVALGWRIDQESFLQEQDLISTLKLRASYGELGNQSGLGLYDHIPVYTVAGTVIPFPGGDQQQAFNPRLPSQSRTWETVTSRNLGIDTGFFGDKLLLTADYFIKRNRDMLINIEVPSAIGISVPSGNFGELETKGWEAAITWRSRVEEIGLQYNIGFNISDSKNKIVDLDQEFAEPVSGFRNIQGYPARSIFAFEADGYFSSEQEIENWAQQGGNLGPGDVRYVDQDGDGVISAPNDLIHAGTLDPRYSFGIDLGAAWRGFDLSVFLQGVGKRNYYLDSNAVGIFLQPWVGNSWEAQNDYWTPENPDARFPRPLLRGFHNYRFSTHWIQDASYIRLKNLQVGYSIPTSVLEKVGIQSARVYFNGRDLWEATDLILFDPEVNTTNGRVYPLNRSYALGLNITF
jgi:TonB-linked SusC/RagA family outer membrane protein